jgi:hypothetical protein
MPKRCERLIPGRTNCLLPNTGDDFSGHFPVIVAGTVRNRAPATGEQPTLSLTQAGIILLVEE